MAKTSAPLLAFSAAGQLGKTVIYQGSRAGGIAKRYVIPPDPRTVNQVPFRQSMSWLARAWKTAPELVRASFEAEAKGKPFTGINAWQKANAAELGYDGNNQYLSWTAPTYAWPSSGPLTLTPTAGSIRFDMAPDTNLGTMQVVQMVAALTPFVPTSSADVVFFDATAHTHAPYHVTFNGLVPGLVYCCAAWFVYQRASGVLQWSINKGANLAPL